MQLSGTLTAFFLFDVAEAIDLQTVRTVVDATVPAPLTPKVTMPSYIQYSQPPIAFDGPTIGTAEWNGFRARFKAFDYGVISVALMRPVPATWDELLAEGSRWQENPELLQAAERCSRTAVDRLGRAIVRPRPEFLSEDYLVFSLIHRPPVLAADALLQEYGAAVAQLLSGDRETLSAQEREEVLRHRISYFATDVVVPTWSGAFVYDSEAGAQAMLDLLEYANSQLLEFRYYDQLLDAELGRIYRQLQRPSWGGSWFGRRQTRAARHVHALFIDVNELTDRTENALKIAGDVYAARVLALVAARLGLDHWKANVKDKLQTLDDIYRFAVEQTAMARGELLELMIVLILVFELILFFLGIMP